MNYAYEIRRQAEASPRAALPTVASALWKAFGEGHLSETEAEALAAVIEARTLTAPRWRANAPAAGTPLEKGMVEIAIPSDGALLSDNPTMPSDRQRSPKSHTGSRPRTDASMERRRRWAASGRLPPAVAARFTLAEQSVLAVVAVEATKRGDCRLALDHIAALAGVSRATVRNAIRQARMHGLVTVEERRLARFRNDTNVICIASREWVAWLRLARSGERGAVPHQSGGGRKSVSGTNTPSSSSVNSEGQRPQKGCRMIRE